MRQRLRIRNPRRPRGRRIRWRLMTFNDFLRENHYRTSLEIADFSGNSSRRVKDLKNLWRDEAEIRGCTNHFARRWSWDLGSEMEWKMLLQGVFGFEKIPRHDLNGTNLQILAPPKDQSGPFENRWHFFAVIPGKFIQLPWPKELFVKFRRAPLDSMLS